MSVHTGRRVVRGGALALWLVSVVAGAHGVDGTRLLDGFDDASSWQVNASDAVVASARQIPGHADRALCLTFDFGKVSGYAQLHRALELEIPDNYEFSFWVRGAAPVNALQFKLVDASGENVWWMQRPRFAVSDDWQQIRIRSRHVTFAWGPIADHRLRRTAALELTVAAVDGGQGEVCFDQLELQQLSPVPAVMPAPLFSASSTRAGSPPALTLDGDLTTAWHSRGTGVQHLTVDFGAMREVGGVILYWLDGAQASRYELQVSNDGTHWRRVRGVSAGNGGRDPLWLGEIDTRWLRLRLLDGPGTDYGVAELELMPLAAAGSANAFFEALAARAPRGQYPRGFTGEQVYWTVVGVDGGPMPALLSEDGAVEPAAGGFSLEPFLLIDGEMVTWADVETRHSLLDGYLPIPRAQWRRGEVSLQVTAMANGDPERSQLLLRYTVSQTGAQPRQISLVLAARPFQVNPPVQFLNTPGGVSAIHTIAWQDDALILDGVRRVFALQPPDAVIASTFDAGSVPELLYMPQPWSAAAVRDDSGFASGALRYDLDLPAGGSAEVVVAIPLSGPFTPPDLDGRSASEWVAGEQARVADGWRAKLNRVELRVPAHAQPLADTVRTALAHILINRDGPAIRPGTRSYARSWIRDGAMTSGALLRLGHHEAVRDYVQWYAPHQFANGKVPCCVDARGADPVPENDSQGELIHAIAELYRYSGDHDVLAALWPHVAAAVDYMDSLRASERTWRNRSPQRAAYFGLMPPSISHEGYSDKPAYSYWDDFWALTGYKDAVEMASALGHADEAARLTRSRDAFAADLYASIQASVERHGIDFLPGAADRGDFDATSTTIALAPAGELANLPPKLLRNTFERYWREFVARRDGRLDWEVYTPYELRTISAFVRLGWRERAGELLDYFLADRRPAGWNQWAEVVGRDPRQPHFIGDMPHGWVGSDFVRAALDLLAYERPADRALVLAAGMPTRWLVGDGIAVQHLATPYGELSYAVRKQGHGLHLVIDSGLHVPPGGLVFAWPYAGVPGTARSGKRVLEWHDRELRIRELPAEIVIAMPGT
ncbi:MAG: discoidin domain-containing protein [Xanthomonadaceae bacterium]|nr:discoidin domain-containing protein [Xanthomonadaceae bacterium]MDP2186471.1 discoidin domain-containing protein [Xanthomonadales bacterium]MDZ4117391.1 discoidin domain-containing protein [Xanthomonadaceae bacterium]MDZ4379595.1 discoidin domain-containing protein [Xanthomonadaceae bacterium]